MYQQGYRPPQNSSASPKRGQHGAQPSQTRPTASNSQTSWNQQGSPDPQPFWTQTTRSNSQSGWPPPTVQAQRTQPTCQNPPPSRFNTPYSQPPHKEPYQSKPPQKKKHFPIGIMLIAVAMVSVLLFLLINNINKTREINAAKAFVAQYDHVFLDNVYVDGINLGRKTFEEGKALVENQIAQKRNGWYIDLKNNHGETARLTADSLGIGWDATDTLQQAWAIGHEPYFGTEDLLEKQKSLQANLIGEHHFSSAEQSINISVIDGMLSSLSASAYRAPVDAACLGFDPSNWNQPFSFQQESWGQMLDTSTVRDQIFALAENLQCGEVLLETTPIAPNVTLDEIKKNYSLRFTAVTPISSKSPEERTANIKNAFNRINGKVLTSGEKFSFNNTVGRRTLENGFQYAVEYVYGNEELGIGGGVCQCSTTVYLAAVQSGMEIVKRRAHSMAVSYADLGKDCTVSDTKGHEIDFIFRNNTEYPIYIMARVNSSPTSKKKLQCEVSIYGRTLENVSYELYANTIETIPKPIEPDYVKDKEGTQVIFTDEEKVVSKGREGYVVESYLITFVDKTETERKLLYKDTYPAKADTVYVGVTPR